MKQKEHKLLARKIEMSQVFGSKAKIIPVTVIKIEEGQKIDDQIWQKDKEVVIVGRSKGRGFQGVMKRWGFKGGPATHGQSDRQRAPGSIGQTTTPGRVFKGKKMPGRMGNQRVTVKGLKIVDIDKEKRLIKVTGAVPGSRNSRIIIKTLKHENMKTRV